MQDNLLQGFKAEGLQDVRDPEFDTFLATNFDDFQGFPWGPATSTLPAALDQPPPNFSFDDLPTPALPPSKYPLPGITAYAPAVHENQHRLLNDQGQAFSVPDLARASFDSGQQAHGRLLVPAPPASPQGGDLAEGTIPSIPEANWDSHSSHANSERVDCAGSGDLHVHGIKNASLAERNKQAQRRHRQRQRDRMGTLEAQVKQLIEEKQALAAEKAALAGQTAVLTQVLQMRDEQLQQYQRQKPSQSEAIPAEKREAGSEEGSNPSESAVSSGLADSLSSVLTLTVREEQKIYLNPDQVKAMKPQEVARTWAEYLSAMMRHLPTAQSSNPEVAKAAEKRISELIQEILVLLMRYALGDLHKMKKFVAGIPIQAEDTPTRTVNNSEMWRGAAHNLQLSQEQRKALCQLRRLFMQKQGGLIQQRQRNIASLQGTMPNAASSHDIAAQFLKAEEAMRGIHRNLRQENQLIVDLIYTFLVRVASPVQAARCLVQSFPWYPDTLCILTWIAAEAGDSKAMELLEQKTMSAMDSHQGSDQGSAGDMSPSMSPA